MDVARRSPDPSIGGGALPKMKPLPPPSAAEIRNFPWTRDPWLIHVPLIHVCDRLEKNSSSLRGWVYPCSLFEYTPPTSYSGR
eukprot:5942359-Pyramimonas_sp.AAC.1